MTLLVLLELVKTRSKNFTLTTDAFVVVNIGSDVVFNVVVVVGVEGLVLSVVDFVVASRETEGDWVVVVVVA